MTMINDSFISQQTTDAVSALALAMAVRLRGENTEATAEETNRATSIVDATLDILGRPFCVLALGCDSNRWQLASAIRRAAREPIVRDEDVTFAEKVIEFLTEAPRERATLDIAHGMVRPSGQVTAAPHEGDPAVSAAGVNGHHELRTGTVDGI